jgi:hypothetical protein
MLYIVHYMKRKVKKKFGDGRERRPPTPTTFLPLFINALFGLILFTELNDLNCLITQLTNG